MRYSFPGIGEKAAASAPSRRSALFIQGIADDGLVKVTVPAASQKMMDELSKQEFGCLLSRHVLGSLNHWEHVNVPGLANEFIVLAGKEDQAMKFSPPAVIVNCIADPDVAPTALDKERKLISQLRERERRDIPVINPPESVLRTTRDRIYEQFSGLPGLHLPRVVRITPHSVADVVQQVKLTGIRLPLLIRAAGTHGGKSMQRIDGWNEPDLLKLERYAYDGRAFYVTEWQDFRDADGLYRKSRIIAVGGEFVPRHRIAGDDWNVHAASRKTLMERRAGLRKEEEEFLARPLAESVSAAAMESLKKIRASLGLDYFGIDGSIREDGSLLVFEINAAFNSMVQDGLDAYPYLIRPVQTIIKAFNDLVAHQAALEAAA